MPDHSRHPARHRFCGAWMLDAATNRHGCVACGAACGCSTCKAARPALLEVPNRCVVLGVDAARRSGWSVWSPCSVGAFLRASGEAVARKHGETLAVCEGALDVARRHGLTAALVIEASPFSGGTARTTFGLGKAVGQWEAAWLAIGGRAAAVVQVSAPEWRRDIWGESPPTDEARAREQAEARGIAGMYSDAPVGPDEAPAILIGKWGMHSPQVNAVLPRKFRQAVAGGEGRAA